MGDMSNGGLRGGFSEGGSPQNVEFPLATRMNAPQSDGMMSHARVVVPRDSTIVLLVTETHTPPNRGYSVQSAMNITSVWRLPLKPNVLREIFLISHEVIQSAIPSNPTSYAFTKDP